MDPNAPERTALNADAAPGGDADHGPRTGQESAKAAVNDDMDAIFNRMCGLLGTASSDHTTAKSVNIPGYEVLHEISRGGQGVVYAATQLDTRRQVAIKVLLEGYAASTATRRRFEREVELAAALRHPHIVTIFHSGETAQGNPFYVMDFVPGVPLNEFVQHTKPAMHDLLRLFMEICQAIQFAHQNGVLHRDLKPGNILVEDDGTPRVLDFGLAKQLDGEQTVVSAEGQLVGTLPYMAPEQVTGDSTAVDTRTDLYALGVILYELLVGRHPYPLDGSVLGVLRHIKETEPAAPTKAWSVNSGITRLHSKQTRIGRCPLDDDVQTILLKLLSKDPDRRYQSANAVVDDLSRYLVGDPIEAKRDSAWYVLSKTLRKHNRETVIIVAVLTILTSGITLTATARRDASVERQKRVRSDQILAEEYAFARASSQTVILVALIDEWANSYRSAAESLKKWLPDNTPYRQAAELLLADVVDAQTLATLQSDPRRAYLAHWVLAERARARGDYDKARFEWEAALQADADAISRPLINARLKAAAGWLEEPDSTDGE